MLVMIAALVRRWQLCNEARSFWLDEAFVAVPLQNPNLLELLSGPLEYGHKLPAGFIAQSWLAVRVFGYSDHTLLMLAFAWGAACIPLFYLVARAYLDEEAVPFAVTAFCCSPLLLYHTAVFKRYSLDVLCALAILWVAARLRAHPGSRRWLLAYAVTGALVVWCSLPAVFVLAGAGLASIGGLLVEGKRSAALRVVGVCAFWILSWGGTMMALGGLHGEAPPGPWAYQFWREQDAFMPAPWTADGLDWIEDKVEDFFDDVVDFDYWKFSLLLLIYGCCRLPRPLVGFLSFLAPALLCLLASYLQVYPFHGRMLLFLVPGAALLLAQGLRQLPLASPVLRLAVQVGLLVMVLDVPFVWLPDQNIRPCLAYLQEHRRSTDKIYVYQWSEPAFRHYAVDYGFPREGSLVVPRLPHGYVKEVESRWHHADFQPVPWDQAEVIWGISELPWECEREIALFQGRVWLLFTHFGWEREFRGILGRYGVQRDFFRVPGGYLVLYEFRSGDPLQQTDDPHGRRSPVVGERAFGGVR